MAKIIVEVGSTCTKIDKYDVNSIKRIKEKTIQFKKHYNEEGKLSDIDVKELIDCINEIKCMFEDIYICGTSIFRNLNVEEKESFLSRFKKETERYFKEISLDEIRKKVDDPNWWYATRAMCAFALVVAEEIGAKYIIPTDISMVYGIIDKKINLKESKICRTKYSIL